MWQTQVFYVLNILLTRILYGLSFLAVFIFNKTLFFPIKVKHERMCSEFCQLFSLRTSNVDVFQYAAVSYAVS